MIHFNFLILNEIAELDHLTIIIESIRGHELSNQVCEQNLGSGDIQVIDDLQQTRFAEKGVVEYKHRDKLISDCSKGLVYSIRHLVAVIHLLNISSGNLIVLRPVADLNGELLVRLKLNERNRVRDEAKGH
jgi:hypothetical protein